MPPAPASTESAAADGSSALLVATPAPEAAAPGESVDLHPVGNLPRGPIWWQVWALALPTLCEQALSFLVGVVDTYLAGHVSKEATAAVGIAVYLGWFVMLATSMVGIGSAALISRAIGAGDRRLAARALAQSMILALATGVVVSAASFLGARELADFLTATPQAEDTAAQFMRYVAWGYMLGAVNMIGSAVLRASGDTVTPMLIMAVVNVVNAGLSAALVYGWFGVQMGVDGIAIGAAAARSLGGVMLLAILLRGVRRLRLDLRLLWPDGPVIRRIMTVGLPAGADTFLMGAAQLAFIKIVKHTGDGDQSTVNMAAHVIAMEVEGFSFMMAIAWGAAAGALVGQYLGAGLPELAARAGHRAALQGGAYGLFSGLLFFSFADLVYSLMSGDAAVRAVGSPAFRILAFAQPFLCAGIVYINALRGAGDTRATMLMTLICGIGLRIPIALLGGIVLGGGLIGAWCGMWADNVVRCFLGLGRFVHGGWKRVRV